MDIFDQPVVHATKHVVKHVQQACPAIPPTCHTVMSHFNVFSGVSHLMYDLIGGIAVIAIGFGLGWYIKGRGLTGVQTDIGNAETSVKNVIATA